MLNVFWHMWWQALCLRKYFGTLFGTNDSGILLGKYVGILWHILAFYLTYILAFYLAHFLTFFLACVLALYLV